MTYSPDGRYYWNGQSWIPTQPAGQVISPQVVHVHVPQRTGITHTMHILLTLLTCGMWLPIYGCYLLYRLVVNGINAARR